MNLNLAGNGVDGRNNDYGDIKKAVVAEEIQGTADDILKFNREVFHTFTFDITW